ncbi:MAG: type II toxin-antitoxin system Phd/YefM family antitoxin [Clostridiales bacterium]|nr:type II toxin-antitoxin system Phd/YefM family antitoxin [Clostridiales bacterium]
MDGRTDKFVSYSDASKDFSKVVRIAEKRGTVFITKNGEPCYAVLDYDFYKAHAKDSPSYIASQRVLEERYKAF